MRPSPSSRRCSPRSTVRRWSTAAASSTPCSTFASRSSRSPRSSESSAPHRDRSTVLGTFLDVFRLRQYFDAATRAREFAGDVLEDLGFLDLARRALIRLPTDRLEVAHPDPFGAFEPMPIPELERHRVALAATGGSGALAAVVGAGRALEECGITPAVLSMCSGSALFGFPLGAGVPAAEVAEFVLALEPEDYVDVDWGALARLGPRLARGFAGIVCGERLESTYRAWLGDRTLGTLAIPTYAPVWNIERNRLEYL